MVLSKKSAQRFAKRRAIIARAPRSGGRSTYHHGDLRRTLIDAAVAVVAEGGLEALSLREAARRAGVSPGAPYHHFSTRAALLAAVAIEGFDRLSAALRGGRDRAKKTRSVPVRFREIGLGYIAFALENPVHFRIMFRPELCAGAETSAEMRAIAGGSAFQLLVDGVTEMQAAGAAPAGDPAPLILQAWSAVHGMASLLLDGPLTRTFPGQESDVLAAMVVDGVIRNWQVAAKNGADRAGGSAAASAKRARGA